MNKLYRSQSDKVATGLIGGLSRIWNIDVSILRILFIISVFLTGGTSLLIYIIAAAIVPKEGPY